MSSDNFENLLESGSESGSVSESGSESESESEKKLELDSDSGSDSGSEKKLETKVEEEEEESEKEVKVKRKEKKTKYMKDILKKKIPSYQTLVKKALENNVSIYNRVGKKLTNYELYDKLKILNLEERKDEKKKTFLKLKKKSNVDELLKMIEENTDLRIKKYRKDFFKDEEIKRFDFLYNLFSEKIINDKKINEFMSFEKKEEKEEEEKKEKKEKEQLKMINERIKEFNSFTDEYIKPTRERFVELLLNVKEEDRKDVIRKYIQEYSPLSFYSILLLHKCLGSNDSDMEKDVDFFKKTEEMLQTSQENKRLTELALSMMKSGDIQDKIEKFSLLQTLIAEMTLLERNIKKKDKEDEDTSVLKKDLQNKEDEKIKLLESIKQKNTFDEGGLIYSQIKLLEKLKVPTDSEKRKELSLLRKAISNLSFDMFTFSGNDKLDNIYGSYLVKDPFASLESLEETKEKMKDKELDLNKLNTYLLDELEQLKKINDLLDDLLASFKDDSIVKINLIKKEFVEKHPYQIKKTIRYIIGKLARSRKSKDKKEILDLTNELIDTHKSITEKTILIVEDLITKQKKIIDTSGYIEDENVRSLINTLEKLKENMKKQEETKKVEYIDLEMDQFILTEKTKDNLEKQKKRLTDKCKSKKYKGDKQILLERIKLIDEKLAELDDEYIQFLSIKNRILSSNYNTESEIKLINEIIETFQIMDIDEFKKYKQLFNEELEVKFINDEYFELSKKKYNLQQKIDKGKLSAADVEILEKQIKLLENDMKLYDQDIVTKSQEHYKKLRELNDIMSKQIDKNKDKVIDILKSRKQVKQNFILPQIKCLPDHFKKPWITNYSKQFYVHFIGDTPEHCINTNKITIDGIIYNEGTRYLDILLCDKKQENDIITVTDKEIDYKLHVLYKVKDEGKDEYVKDNLLLYQKELDWISKNAQSVEDKINIYLEKSIKEVTRNFLFKIVKNILCNYFDENNCSYITTKILDLFRDEDNVKSVLNRLGSLVIFLDPLYMQKEAMIFNKRLESGYIKFDEIINFTPDLILFELYEYMKILSSDKQFSNIVIKIRENKILDITIDEKFNNVISFIKDKEAVYQQTKRILEKKHQLDSIERNKKYKLEKDKILKEELDIKEDITKEEIILLRQQNLEKYKKISREERVIVEKEKQDIDNLEKIKYIDDLEEIKTRYRLFYEYCLFQLNAVYDINQVKVKVEESIHEFVYKTVYNILLSNRVILHHEKLKPFQKLQVYKTLSKKDCLNENSIPENDIVYYIEDGELYCFSIKTLIQEKIMFNTYTQKPFTQDFLSFLGLLQPYKDKKEEKLELELELELKENLKLLYSDIMKMDNILLEKDPEFKEIYVNELLDEKSLSNFMLEEVDVEKSLYSDSELKDMPPLESIPKKNVDESSE